MEYDRDKVDEITLALLWLTGFKSADVDQRRSYNNSYDVRILGELPKIVEGNDSQMERHA
jgi:hypothetical protein